MIGRTPLPAAHRTPEARACLPPPSRSRNLTYRRRSPTPRVTGAPAAREASPGSSRQPSSSATRSSPWAVTCTWPPSPGTWASSRCRVFWLGDTQHVTPRYIALENIGDEYHDPVGYARKLHPLAEYAVAGEAGGYVVLERRRAAGG